MNREIPEHLDAEQAAINRQHLNNPQPGDYWYVDREPMCFVLSVTPNYIVICSDQIDNGPDYKKVWDYDKAHEMTKANFKALLSTQHNAQCIPHPDFEI